MGMRAALHRAHPEMVLLAGESNFIR